MAKQNKYADAARKAQQQTDEEYRTVIAGLIKLTGQELEKLFPKKADQTKVAELLALVKSGTSSNEKILKLKQNSEKFGEIVLKLLKTVV